jgi:hypothetical protein
MPTTNLIFRKLPSIIQFQEPGLPDFSLYYLPKRWKNIPKSHNIYQMDVKRSNGHKVHQHRPLQDPKMYPNLDFWVENTPSGNPAKNEKQLKWSLNERKKLVLKKMAGATFVCRSCSNRPPKGRNPNCQNVHWWRGLEVSSSHATEETGAMGREIESLYIGNRVIAFLKKM